MPSPYDLNNLPRSRAGMLVGTENISQPAVASAAAGVLPTGTIIGTSLTTTANAVNQIVFVNGYDNAEIRGTYVVPATGFVAADFHLYIQTLLSGFVQFTNFTNWGLAATVNVTSATYGVFGTLTVNATSLTLTAPVDAPIPEGRIVIPDFAAVFLADGNQTKIDVYRLPVLANTTAQTLSVGGVSCTMPWISAYNLTGDNRVQSGDRYSVLKQGVITVSSIAAIATLNTPIFVECAVGANQGRITPTSSVTTVALDPRNYQLLETANSVNGICKMRVSTM
jgi:hypothetical protein